MQINKMIVKNKSIISFFERYNVHILVLYFLLLGIINGIYFYSPSPDEWKYLHNTINMAEELKNGDWIGNSMVGVHGFMFKLIPAIVFIWMEPTIYMPYFYHLIINIFIVFLTYKVGLHLLKSKNWAFVATLVLISSPLFIYGNLNYLREMPSHFSLILILYLLLFRKNVIWVGLALMLAIDAKEYVGIMAFAAVFIHTFFDLIREYGLFSIKFLQKSLGKFVVYVVPTILYIYLMFWTSLVPENPTLTSLLKLNIGAADSKIYFSLSSFLYSSKNKNSDIIAKNEYLINRNQWLKSKGMRDSLTKLIKYRNNIENNIDYSKLKNMPLFQDNENLRFSVIDTLMDDILLAYQISEDIKKNKNENRNTGFEITSIKVERIDGNNIIDYSEFADPDFVEKTLRNFKDGDKPDRKVILAHFINEFNLIDKGKSNKNKNELIRKIRKIADERKSLTVNKNIFQITIEPEIKTELYNGIIHELSLHKIIKPKVEIPKSEFEPLLASKISSNSIAKYVNTNLNKPESLNESNTYLKPLFTNLSYSSSNKNNDNNKIIVASNKTSLSDIALNKRKKGNLEFRNKSNNAILSEVVKNENILSNNIREKILNDGSITSNIKSKATTSDSRKILGNKESSIASLLVERELATSKREATLSDRNIQTDLSDTRSPSTTLRINSIEGSSSLKAKDDSQVEGLKSPKLATVTLSGVEGRSKELSPSGLGVRSSEVTTSGSVSRTARSEAQNIVRESGIAGAKSLPQSIKDNEVTLTQSGRDSRAGEESVNGTIAGTGKNISGTTTSRESNVTGSSKGISELLAERERELATSKREGILTETQIQTDLSINRTHLTKVGDISESITRNRDTLQILGKFNPAYTDNDIKKEYNKLDSNAKDKIKKQFDKLGTEEKKQIVGLINKNIVLAKLTSGELNFKSIQRDKIENINPNIKIKIPLEPTNLNNPVIKSNESSDKKGKLIDGFKSTNSDSTSKEKDIIDLEKESLVYNPVYGEKEDDFDRFKLYESSYEKYKAYFELFTDKIFAHYTFNYISYPIFIVLLSLMTIVLLMYKWRENPDWIFIITFLFMALAVYIFRTHQPRYLHPAIISIPYLMIYASKNYLQNKIFLSFFLSLSILLNIYQIYINDFTYTLLPSLFLLIILVPVLFVNNTLKRYFIYLFITLYLFLNIAYVLNGKMENIAKNPVKNFESDARQYAKCFDLNSPGTVYFISDYPGTNIIHSTINFYNRDINSSSEEGMNIMTYVNPDFPKFRLNKYYIPHLFTMFKFSINYSMTNWNQIKGFLPYNKISKVTFLIPDNMNWDDYEVKYVKNGQFNLMDNSKSGILQDWRNIMFKYQMLLFKTRSDWLELESKHRIGNDKTLYIFRINDKYLD